MTSGTRTSTALSKTAWKATPNFLLSLGLRYDAQLVPGPDMPNTANPVAFNATSQINPDLKMFQPRVGFAWNPYPGTVVRGGYGIFYGQISNSSYYTLRRENGVYQKQYGPITPAVTPVPYVAAGAAVSGSGTVAGACVPTGWRERLLHQPWQLHLLRSAGWRAHLHPARSTAHERRHRRAHHLYRRKPCAHRHHHHPRPSIPASRTPSPTRSISLSSSSSRCAPR